MVDPRSPRFFADGVLASCLTGHKISQASGDPVGTVARLQQAIVDLNDSDLGALLAVDGIFGPLTGTAITKYKAKHGLIPADAVVEQATFSLLDDYYEHELIEDHAQALQSSFDIGSRIGNRTELVSGVVLCPFQHGQCVEFGRFRIILMPEASSKAWKQAGGISGSFGLPTNDPFKLDATRATGSGHSLRDSPMGVGSIDQWIHPDWISHRRKGGSGERQRSDCPSRLRCGPEGGKCDSIAAKHLGLQCLEGARRFR
jgi:hypothetical protein